MMDATFARLTRCLAVVAVCAGGAAGFTACDPPPPSCPTAVAQYADVAVKNLSQANAERTVFCLTNQQRVANGRAELTSSALLSGTARAHAQDAVTRKWWVDGADPHVTPDGKSPSDRMRAAGYCPTPTYWKVAENVYWGWGSPAQTPRMAVQWWMGSTGHRLNILDPDLHELGVGVVQGAPRPGTYPDAAAFVQNFGTCR